MQPPPFTPAQLDELYAKIDRWMTEQGDQNPAVDAVERDETERRWFVRLRGEERDVFSVWFWLRQRTLFVETYFMPAPQENHAALFEHLLVRNASMHGLRFAQGGEDAVYLMGEVDNSEVDDDRLDRLLGTAYAYTEQFFRPAMRIGYASVFRG